MTAKLCNRCEAAADFGINVVVSTIGKPSRQQKCSASVPLCRGCLERLIGELGTLSPSSLGQSVNTAYTAIASQSENKSTHHSRIPSMHGLEQASRDAART
jgi:hypothetical protein